MGPVELKWMEQVQGEECLNKDSFKRGFNEKISKLDRPWRKKDKLNEKSPEAL